jgi:hypothetical protein
MVPSATRSPAYTCRAIGFKGTSVATETCGQVSVLKFSDTFWVYWIWVYCAGNCFALGIADVAVTLNTGAGAPVGTVGTAFCDSPIFSGPTSIWVWIVSTQKIADMSAASAL